jgi:hypothetical protein
MDSTDSQKEYLTTESAIIAQVTTGCKVNVEAGLLTRLYGATTWS